MLIASDTRRIEKALTQVLVPEGNQVRTMPITLQLSTNERLRIRMNQFGSIAATIDERPSYLVNCNAELGPRETAHLIVHAANNGWAPRKRTA